MRILLVIMTMLLASPALSATLSCKASYYGKRFHGRPTANGETFNMHAMTAAHKTLPFGTRVVVSRGNHKVTVRINDRGPYKASRCIDLSRAAFERLAPRSKGVITVILEW